jgi:transcriptional regulator with XRE-family HTH domain
MNTYHEHDCEESALERISTPEKPYHYVGSGLGNVYLIGVKYWVCRVCGKQSAEIPLLNLLLASIGRTLVEKQSPLTGEQVRYLRKRLGKASKEFAALVGVTPERYSAIEASEAPLAEGRDKLVRFVYRVFSADRKLKEALADKRQIEQWLLALHGREHAESIVGTWLGKRRWRVHAAPTEFQGCAA